MPPIKGNDLPQVAVVRSIADVERVNALVQDAKNAVVIGGGVLGLEAAWELRRFGLDVTVLESAPVLMAGKIDAPTVRMLTGIAECKGISILTGVQIDVYKRQEKYQDEKAVEFHRATEYFRTLVPQIGALRVKPSEVSTCTVVAVSYTHLDVYKRQMKCRERLRLKARRA